jgi:hypothetical protein
MVGTVRKQRSLPAVLRSFVPTRLAEEVLSGAYERLLAVSDRLATVNRKAKDEEVVANGVLGQFAKTGGRYA